MKEGKHTPGTGSPVGILAKRTRSLVMGAMLMSGNKCKG